MFLDAGKEIFESCRRMRDLEFLEQTAVRETGGNRVALRADIDTDTQLQSLGGSAWIAPSVNKILGSSFGLVYLQSHDRHAKGGADPLREDTGFSKPNLVGSYLMRWTAPTTGIAMCQIPVAVAGRRESAYG